VRSLPWYAAQVQQVVARQFQIGALLLLRQLHGQPLRY
jgi:hypothetical protein